MCLTFKFLRGLESIALVLWISINLTSSKCGIYDKATLVSYTLKKKIFLVLKSSLHCAAEIDETTNKKSKPNIVTFKN